MNTIDVVHRCGAGYSIKNRACLRKDAMRKRDAIYGGEMSAHHYKDFLLRQWGHSLVAGVGIPLGVQPSLRN